MSAAAGIDMDVFLRRYLIHAAREVPNRAPGELRECANAHLALGRVRLPGQLLIKAGDYNGDTTAINIVTDDAPFLIDSIRAELTRAGRTVSHILHPQLVVSRDDRGELVTVYDIEDNAEQPAGTLAEAWLHVEVDTVPDDQLDELVAALIRVLTDVHYAVDDRPQMYALMGELADHLTADPGQFDRDISAEAGDLLRWFASGNYMVLGHAAYSANELAMAGLPAASDVHGVLRGTAVISPLELLPAFRGGAPLVIFKSPLTSTVRRSAHYDCVIVITPHRVGEPSLVHAFLGLINSDDDGNVARVPVVRKRIAEVLLRSGVRANSYSGRQLVSALRTLPRDELLEAPTGDLLRLAPLVVDRAERHAVGVFARTHLNRDFVTVLVYFPADRLGPETRRKVRETIVKFWPGDIAARDDRIVELGLARMQFLIALKPAHPTSDVDRRTVEEEVRRVTRRWSDDLADLIAVASSGPDEATRWLRRYEGAFPEAYKEDFDATTAVTDIARLEGLDPRDTGGRHQADDSPEANDGLDFSMYVAPPDDAAERRLKVYRSGPSLSLAKTLPIFGQMGIEVLDERPYEIHRSDDTVVWIYDFGLRMGSGTQLTEAGITAILAALRLLWRDEIEQDGFNALIPRADLTWWQVNILRAYAKYLRQIGTTFSQGYIEQALTENAATARKLVELFEARFDPDRAGPTAESMTDAIEKDLVAVASLDQDRILRSLLGLIRATVRTNAYRATAGNVDRTNDAAVVAMKFDPKMIKGLPQPRPRHEIWVYGPRVEGVHLRFGPIARGGLRWSDRREDFRTEVLGLVKAQMVKNAVIVPVGAKGGFVGKRLPDPAVDRDAWLAEGVACYQTFIGCLLDLTDNLVTVADGTQRVAPPAGVRRYDGDDPYLVVAADKGTATFSDIANGISVQRGYWLGDAFASGGSIGYDHKVMGITARGAWESVKYHFRELGTNVQTEPFTVAGIGDMSGDVFGNGMLLSEEIRLVAAFDHRHIFLDPDPDPATSIVERRRLFDLPRSSWADYSRALISAGGGVFTRDSKTITISPQVAARLAITPEAFEAPEAPEATEATGIVEPPEAAPPADPAGAITMAPNELIRAILRAPVDLLWNGGIGTYVKATAETNADAGDRANDTVRVDGRELRCRVVGEGGNLGFTQLGRIEYARAGGHINTDAIDNSAGVDTSDHEVNLKVLLDRVLARGAITVAERTNRLVAVTDDVASHVLRDNYEQNVLLGVARETAPVMVNVHGRMIRALEAAGELDREIEFLPSDAELTARADAGEGLTSPELAVLAAYAKIGLTKHLVDSTLPDEEWFTRVLRSYFPAPIVAEFPESIATHPLGREITTTVVVNDMVNRAGISFAYRAVEETGVEFAEIARGYTVVREIFGLESLWRDIEALDGVVAVDAQLAAYSKIRRVIDRSTRWLADVRFPISDVGTEIARFGPAIAELAPQLPELLCGVELTALETDTQELEALGLPHPLALRISALLPTFLVLDVVEIAAATNEPVRDVAALLYALSARLSVDVMLTKITLLPREDRWSTLARAALRHDLYAALKAITTAVLKETQPGRSPQLRITQWEHSNQARVDRATVTVTEALGRDQVDLATLSVALRVMRNLSG